MATRPLTGLVAGLLAGAAGVTAHNAVNYVHQAVTGKSAPSSPASGVPANTADGAADTSSKHQAAAAGPLGGTVLGLVVGAVAGSLRGVASTPPQPVASALVGLAAWGSAVAAAAATGSAPTTDAEQTLVDALSHLAFGVVTVLTLHQLVDPRTAVVGRR